MFGWVQLLLLSVKFVSQLKSSEPFAFFHRHRDNLCWLYSYAGLYCVNLRNFDRMAAVSWDDLPDVTESGRAVLKGAGITAAVAKRLVEELGYVEASDLKVSRREVPYPCMHIMGELLPPLELSVKGAWRPSMVHNMQHGMQGFNTGMHY